MDVPSLTPSHASLTAHDQGIVRSDRHTKGHHFVHVGVRAPRRLTSRAAELWRRFAATEDDVQGTVEGVDSPHGHRYYITALYVDLLDIDILRQLLFMLGQLVLLGRNGSPLTFIPFSISHDFIVTDVVFQVLGRWRGAPGQDHTEVRA